MKWRGCLLRKVRSRGRGQQSRGFSTICRPSFPSFPVAPISHGQPVEKRCPGPCGSISREATTGSGGQSRDPEATKRGLARSHRSCAAAKRTEMRVGL